MDANTGPYRVARSGPVNQVYYSITLKHDVPNYTWFWIAAVLLLIPPIVYTIRAQRLRRSDGWTATIRRSRAAAIEVRA